MTDEALRAAVAAALAEQGGGEPDPSDVALRRLSAGANRQTYRAAVAGRQDVVLQVERQGTSRGLPGDQQASLLRQAAAGGVPVPEVLASGTGEDGPLAGHWTITRHVEGESIPRVLLRTLDADARAALLQQVASAAAAVHRLPVDGLPPPEDELTAVTTWLGATGPPAPAVALAVRWLERNRPASGAAGVVHGDLRLGNLLVDVEGGQPELVALLDWELAHAGSAHADLGWLCSRTWRFGEAAAAGGLGSREDLVAAYAAAGGEAPDREALRWWELLACVRWAAMCGLMGADAARRDPPPLEPAMVGRRAVEAAHDCLRLLPGGVESGAPAPGGAGVDESRPSTEPPAERGSGHDLLAAAAAELDRHAEDPDDPRRWPARVAANAVRTASRQWWLAERNRARHQERLGELGVADDDELRTRITQGAFDDDLADLALVLAATTRDALSVVHPGYATQES